MTVNGIPEDYPGTINITIRDNDINSLIRSWMILVFLYDYPPEEPTAEHLVHLWYSAFVTETMDKWIHDPLYELVVALNKMVEQRRSYRKVVNVDRITTRGKTDAWEPIAIMTKKNIDLTLNYSNWSYLKRYVSPKESSQRQAYLAQEAVVACPSRLDSRDRHLVKLPPPERLSHKRFQDFGILHTFSCPKYEYFKPNITLFDFSDDTNPKWLIDDTMSPERGWSRSHYKRTFVSGANDDIFGKLYYYIKDDIITTFHRQLYRLRIKFSLEEIKTSDLVGNLPYYRKYDRILVSGIDESPNSIPKGFISCLGGSLKPSNPHATLITPRKLALRPPVRLKDKEPTPNFDEVFGHFLPEPCSDRPSNLRKYDVRAVVRAELEQFRSKMLSLTNFSGDWKKYGIHPRSRNTITKRWPYIFPQGANFTDPALLEKLQDYVAEERDPGLVYLE
ncbi:hypothetical protein F5Y06DRAFT_288187 [Hypoxylon sp. FL0890]|nr:hypothetical protein F5Y06DRAFT_288187 [Hypoxylon sp. FL0890]